MTHVRQEARLRFVRAAQMIGMRIEFGNRVAVRRIREHCRHCLRIDRRVIGQCLRQFDRRVSVGIVGDLAAVHQTLRGLRCVAAHRAQPVARAGRRDEAHDERRRHLRRVDEKLRARRFPRSFPYPVRSARLQAPRWRCASDPAAKTRARRWHRAPSRERRRHRVRRRSSSRRGACLSCGSGHPRDEHGHVVAAAREITIQHRRDQRRMTQAQARPG